MTAETVVAWIRASDLASLQNWFDVQGEDLNLPIEEGWSALHIACSAGALEIVRELLDRGALVNINSHNPLQATPLHLAVAISEEEKAVKIARTLIACGAELNIARADGATALHIAVGLGALAVIEELVLAGADPFLKDSKKRNAGDWLQAKSIELGKAAQIRSILKRAFSLV